MDTNKNAAPIRHTVNLGSKPATHCGIPTTERPPITGNLNLATCPDCANVRKANGWAR